jgi:hypothetical protein
MTLKGRAVVSNDCRCSVRRIRRVAADTVDDPPITGGDDAPSDSYGPGEPGSKLVAGGVSAGVSDHNDARRSRAPALLGTGALIDRHP